MSPSKAPTDIDQIVGAMVRVARKDAGMSQEKLGEALGLTFQQVQKYEKGVNRISAGRLFEFAQILGKPIDWFYSDQLDRLNTVDNRDASDTDAARALKNFGLTRFSRSFKALARIEDDDVMEATADLIERMADLSRQKSK